MTTVGFLISTSCVLYYWISRPIYLVLVYRFTAAFGAVHSNGRIFGAIICGI